MTSSAKIFKGFLFFTLAFQPAFLLAEETVTKRTAPGEYQITFRLNPGSFEQEIVTKNGLLFTRYQIEGMGLSTGRKGTPETPRFHSWLVLPPHVGYSVKITSVLETSVKDVLLYPHQPDVEESVVSPPFYFDRKSYSKNTWLGEKRVVLNRELRLGKATVLPIAFQPFTYNPQRKELKIFKEITLSLRWDASSYQELCQTINPATPFLSEQLQRLTLNGEELLRECETDLERSKTLIITTKAFESYAKELSALSNGESEIAIETVAEGLTSAKIKAVIKEQQRAGDLSFVTILGNTDQIPMHQISETYGDAFYSFLEGNDEIADLGLGRIPVSNETEAKIALNKIKTYRDLEKAGFINKRVMLLAHKQDYPGKYTGNAEKIRNAPNPLGLNYLPQYGGNGATNKSALAELQKGYAIINYRGHGSSTAWTGWAKDGGSFGLQQVGLLPVEDSALSFIFNVACSNATLQNSSLSLAEKQLFPEQDVNSLKGAIGVLGATKVSATETNHRFNFNLFHFIQIAERKNIGALYALANNKLVQDNGGNPVSNVRMYILLSDPTLVPWIK